MTDYFNYYLDELLNQLESCEYRAETTIGSDVVIEAKTVYELIEKFRISYENKKSAF